MFFPTLPPHWTFSWPTVPIEGCFAELYGQVDVNGGSQGLGRGDHHSYTIAPLDHFGSVKGALMWVQMELVSE